ncbi:MAG: lipid A biosynthesis acyltransferase [Campylobacter sp.]|nr:lipid A biosynthesis acyltransferase [Campylobacter sp.]
MQKIKYLSLYILYVIFEFLFHIMPKNLSKKVLEGIAFLAFKFDKTHNKIAMANLNLVFKDTKSKNEKEKIIATSYKTLAFNMFELLENQRLSKDEIFKKMRVINGDIITKALASGRKIIFVTAHYGGWEITLPGIALMFDMKVGVVNKKMQNPYIHAKYAAAREKNNITMIEKHSAAKGMLKTLLEGNQVAIVIDQHTDSGCEIDFLGVKDMATDAVARLALKLDALIIPILTTNNDFRSYEITIYEPIDPLKINDEDKILVLTKLQNDIISSQILAKPDFWLWQHKRFRKFNAEIYN